MTRTEMKSDWIMFKIHICKMVQFVNGRLAERMGDKLDSAEREANDMGLHGDDYDRHIRHECGAMCRILNRSQRVGQRIARLRRQLRWEMEGR